MGAPAVQNALDYEQTMMDEPEEMRLSEEDMITRASREAVGAEEAFWSPRFLDPEGESQLE